MGRRAKTWGMRVRSAFGPWMGARARHGGTTGSLPPFVEERGDQYGQIRHGHRPDALLGLPNLRHHVPDAPQHPPGHRLGQGRDGRDRHRVARGGPCHRAPRVSALRRRALRGGVPHRGELPTRRRRGARRLRDLHRLRRVPHRLPLRGAHHQHRRALVLRRRRGGALRGRLVRTRRRGREVHAVRRPHRPGARPGVRRGLPGGGARLRRPRRCAGRPGGLRRGDGCAPCRRHRGTLRRRRPCARRGVPHSRALVRAFGGQRGRARGGLPRRRPRVSRRGDRRLHRRAPRADRRRGAVEPPRRAAVCALVPVGGAAGALGCLLPLDEAPPRAVRVLARFDTAAIALEGLCFVAYLVWAALVDGHADLVAELLAGPGQGCCGSALPCRG